MTMDSGLKWTVAMAIGVQHSQGFEFRSSPNKLIAKKSRNEQQQQLNPILLYFRTSDEQNDSSSKNKLVYWWIYKRWLFDS